MCKPKAKKIIIPDCKQKNTIEVDYYTNFVITRWSDGFICHLFKVWQTSLLL